MIRFKETTIALNHALFVHKQQSNTWIQMAINVETSNLQPSSSLITSKKIDMCFVHPIFRFWSLLVTKLRKYENIT